MINIKKGLTRKINNESKSFKNKERNIKGSSLNKIIMGLDMETVVVVGLVILEPLLINYIILWYN